MRLFVLKFVRALAVVFTPFGIGFSIYDAIVYFAAPTPAPVTITAEMPKGATVLPAQKVETGTFKISTDLAEWNLRREQTASPEPPIVTYGGGDGKNNSDNAVVFHYWLARKDGGWYHAENAVPLKTPGMSPFDFLRGAVTHVERTGETTFVAHTAKTDVIGVVFGTGLMICLCGLIGPILWSACDNAVQNAKWDAKHVRA